jgi:hypothetical protein
MGFFQRLFSREVPLSEMKTQLTSLERERRRKAFEMRKIEHRQQQAVEKLKAARKNAQKLEVDYLWEEIRTLQLDAAYVKREAKILNLETIAVKKYVRGVERLERTQNKDSVRNLIQRLRTSGLDAKLEKERLHEQDYLDELNAIFAEAGIEAEQIAIDEDDPDKEAFLRQIDEINHAEASGNHEVARAKEAELKKSIEAEPEL